MAMTVNVHEAKTHLSHLLEDVEHGDDVAIARRGTPAACLVPANHVCDRQLDSPTALWALISPVKLGREAARAITDGANALYMSPAAAMELTTKQRIGKLPEIAAVAPHLLREWRQLGFQDLCLLGRLTQLVSSRPVRPLLRRSSNQRGLRSGYQRHGCRLLTTPRDLVARRAIGPRAHQLRWNCRSSHSARRRQP